MTEKRTSKTEQRIATIHDEKQQIPDLVTSELIPPSTGIFDEPVRYYKANKEWTKFIEGWLTWLAEVAPWYQAQEHDYPAIDAILDYLVGVELPKYPISAFDDCVEYGTFNDATSFTPNNPFAPNEDYEPSLLELKWARFGDIISPDILPDWLELAIDVLGENAGYLSDDLFLILDARDFFQWTQLVDMLNAITSLNVFPSITVNLDGSGIAQLKFLNVPFGGSVLIYWDIEPTLQQIIDVVFNGEIFSNFILAELNRDLLALPPETISTRIVEVVLEEDTAHEIKCIFIPTFNDEAPFVFPFGGFRELQVCDGIEVIGVSTGTKTRPDIYRQGVLGVTTTEELCAAVECGIINVFQRAISGQAGNVVGGVTINPDGSVTISEETQSGGSIGAASESLSGSAYNVANEVSEFVLQIADWHAEGKTQAYVVSRLALLYLITDPTQAVADYYTFLAGDSMVTNIDNLAEKLFCNGISKQSIALHAVDQYSTNEARETVYLDITDCLTQEQLEIWEDEGSAQPRTDYLSYACTLRADNERSVLDLTANLAEYVALFGYENVTSNRLIRLTVSGKFVDAGTGNELDIKFIKDSGGNLVDAGWTAFGFADIGSANFMMFPPAELPYSETNVYQWTYEIIPDQYDGFVYKPANLAWITSAVGQIDILIEDLGEV